MLPCIGQNQPGAFCGPGIAGSHDPTGLCRQNAHAWLSIPMCSRCWSASTWQACLSASSQICGAMHQHGSTFSFPVRQVLERQQELTAHEFKSQWGRCGPLCHVAFACCTSCWSMMQEHTRLQHCCSCLNPTRRLVIFHSYVRML